MMILRTNILFFILFSCFSCTSIHGRNNRNIQSESVVKVFLEKINIGNLPVKQRVGLFLEDDGQEFKGCILYLQGLGDSILNHSPYFKELRRNGYRIISFDYLGQGGSEGSMSDTRVSREKTFFGKLNYYNIGNQAKFVWKKYSIEKDPIRGKSCKNSPKFIIGWSTGGLVAYKLAHEGWGDGHVLLAPGIVPRLCVGEAAKNCLNNLTKIKIITQRTLTQNKFADIPDPHIDPIRPNSPMLVKKFAINLMATASRAARWKIRNPKVRGLVFLSSENDSYVNTKSTLQILKLNAPTFKVISYEGSGALHELDNELDEISLEIYRETVRFFDGIE